MGQNWYYTRNREQLGPVEWAQLQQLAASGQLKSDDLAWTEGMPHWAAVSTLPGLGQTPPRGDFPPPPINPEPSRIPNPDPRLNYYSPPDPQTGGYAGFWLRFVAWLIDTVILSVALLIFGNILQAILQGLLRGFLGRHDSMIFAEFIVFMVNNAIYWLYYAIQESGAAQATLGKRLLHLKVTDLNGQRISFARATGRYFSMFLSWLSFGAGYVMVGVTARKQGLHDMMAGTLVVRAQ